MGNVSDGTNDTTPAGLIIVLAPLPKSYAVAATVPLVWLL